VIERIAPYDAQSKPLTAPKPVLEEKFTAFCLGIRFLDGDLELNPLSLVITESWHIDTSGDRREPPSYLLPLAVPIFIRLGYQENLCLTPLHTKVLHQPTHLIPCPGYKSIPLQAMG
jgi:hypothetical protein